MSPGAVEQQPRSELRCRYAANALLALSFAFDLILVMNFGLLHEVKQFAPQEFEFVKQIAWLQSLLANLSWNDTRTFGGPLGAGFAFWLFTALISMPLRGHATLMVLFLRLVFVAMKYAAVYIVYKRLYLLSARPLFALLVLCFLLAVPAYVFDGNVLGPQYAVMLLLAVGWDALFNLQSRAQMRAALFFMLAAAVQINVLAMVAMLFPALFMAHGRRDRVRYAADWVIGAIIPVVLMIFSYHPLDDLLGFGQNGPVTYAFENLYKWYVFDAARNADSALMGGWGVDFLIWPMFAVFFGFAVYADLKPRGSIVSQSWTPYEKHLVIWTFYAASFACFLTSFVAPINPWIVFAPFLLLVAGGSLLIGLERSGTDVMMLFVLIYVALFGMRDIIRWDHRIQRFESFVARESVTKNESVIKKKEP